MINIEFPDGSKKQFEAEVTGLEIAQGIGERLAKAALAIKIDGTTTDLTTTISTDCKIQILTFNDEEGKQIFWHSSAHLMAMAVKELYPNALPTIGPSIDNGFYYDFASEPFKPEDLEKIESKMKEFVEKDLPFVKVNASKDEAKEMFKNNKYKLEMIEELENITIYTNDGFRDLCKGPHVPSTGYLKAFKLTKIGSAYWKADSSNDSLQRIYGVSFPDKKLLNKYTILIEEAEKRDHRKIGKELDFFSFHDEAPGMPFFHDRGTYIWNKLVNFVMEKMIIRNYEINKTPIILNKSLWLQSGHWDHYKENMYYTKIDNNDYAVKPMNCPGNILIYKTKSHSYRDLPLRAGEFGLVHRHELSGVLSGLFRVRAFTQDDAHVFCTEDQIKSEVNDLINFMDEIYSTFGFEFHIELSTRPEKAMGDEKLWDIAETKLKEVLVESKKEFVVNEGDGAFYGPKIDFHLKDAIGRTWQCGTIQLDFQMPEKFDLSYEGKDGTKHKPVMLHRTILGSVERFMGVLIEHYAGKLPLWINPNQVIVLPVADRFQEYAEEVASSLKSAGIRCDIDARTESIPKKVRDSELQRYNYILVVGDKEINDKTVTVRTRDNKVEGMIKYSEFQERLLEEIKNKK